MSNYNIVLEDLETLLQEKDKIMVFVRGIPGSGKSTFAKRVCQTPYKKEEVFAFPEHCEADMYYFAKYGEYKWSVQDVKNAHKYCQLNVETAMLLGHHVVVSNTFIKQWELEEYIKLCEKYGYNYVVIRMYSEYESKHNVPKETIERMKNQMEDISNEWIVK